MKKGKVVLSLLLVLMILTSMFPVGATSEHGVSDTAVIELTIPDELSGVIEVEVDHGDASQDTDDMEIEVSVGDMSREDEPFIEIIPENESPADDPGEIEVVLPNEDEAADETLEETIPDEPLTTDESMIPDLLYEYAEAGDLVFVTTRTRVYMDVDDSVESDYDGDLFLGKFLRDAVVRVEDVAQDVFGSVWYRVAFLYGPEENGEVLCTATNTVHVLADETFATDADDMTVTDYGYPAGYFRPMTLAFSSFDLRDNYGGVASYYAGEYGLHATTGHDNEYLQIARHDEYGTIYATPHYLKGETAYCLENTMNSPVVRDNASGPYEIVDLAGYRVTPGFSGYIFSDKTMHALAWVLRHTYPFMVVDRSDADNNQWSRVAGQFAIREVVKQLEGAFYVREYWYLEEFYRPYDYAPGVYLEYAKWLAAEALSYANSLPTINVYDKSVTASGGQYIGTALLYTTASQMRIPKSAGTITGNSGGDDWEYYYLYSGDTITVTSQSSSFSIPVEALPSADDEAAFFVGVTYEDIQKLLLPVYGDPYPVAEISLDFEVPHGAVRVSKTSAQTGAVLSGAVFELLNSAGAVVQTQTTGADGTATFSNLTAGAYSVREKSAPQGYLLNATAQNVTVTAGNTSQLSFTNDVSTSRIRIEKTDAQTGNALSGAQFTVTRISGLSGAAGLVATLNTGADGSAETDWLPWGRYRIEETSAPEHYVNAGFTTEIDAHEHGKTYTFSVSNESTKGYIHLTKTDSLDQRPIADVRFEILAITDSGEVSVGSMTTDENGIAVSEALPKGEYIVREIYTPDGYVSEYVELSATVKPDETTYLTATNKPIQGYIQVVKRDALTGEPLAGAEFTITRIGDVIWPNRAAAPAIIITTRADGTATSPLLRWGRYRVAETKVPDHYVDSGFETEVVVYEENLVTVTVEVENEPTKGFIQITKTDSLDQRPIRNVWFDICQITSDGETYVDSIVTDADGIAVSDALNKGKYIVRESDTPDGYVREFVELAATVKSDETTMLTATNEPIQGYIQIMKTDELTGEPLAGAEFTITRIGDIVRPKTAAAPEPVAVIVTDENGVATSPLLRWGRYLVEETGVPEHFVDNGFETEVLIQEENLKTVTIEVDNEPTKGYIQVTKTDSLDQRPLEGVWFDIYHVSDGNETCVGDMVTDESGIAISDPLPKGEYIVRESSHLDGYVSEMVELSATVRSDETTSLTATNEPIQGYIQIIKTDELTGEALAGAEFTIYRIGDISSPVREIQLPDAVITTGEDGIATSPLLRWGRYRVVESVVPEHFVDNDFEVEVEIAEENLKTVTIEVTNEPTKGYIQIVKTDSLDHTPIEGVQFDIYYADEYGDGLATSVITNKDGVALTEPLRKGVYKVVEHENPVGYVTELNQQPAIVWSDETSHLFVSNEPIQGYIEIIKTDELTGEPLAGAEFTIYRTGDVSRPERSVQMEPAAIIVTDENGIATSPLLRWGRYLVEETGVPEHYVDNAFSCYVNIKEETLKTVTIEVTNEPTKGFIRLVKTDRLNGNPIKGVKFEVIYNDQFGSDLATTMTTDADGVAISEPLRKGQYLVREQGANAGYVFETVELNATVKSDETTELAVTNQPVQVQLLVMKRDKEETEQQVEQEVLTQEPLPTTRGDGVLTGAEFQILAGDTIKDRQGNVLFKKDDVVVPSLKTEGDYASVMSPPLWPGLYKVVELTPPTGYQPSEKRVTIDARSAAKYSDQPVYVYEGTKTNKILYGAQALVKILGADVVGPDSDRVEAPEQGAEFEVHLKRAGSYENAREFERDYLITDEDGYAKTKALPYGLYILKQTKGAEGYEIKGEIAFEIDGTEDIAFPPIMTLSDRPILYRMKLTKTDAETGNIVTLPGASFKLSDAQGNPVVQTVHYPVKKEIDTFVTDETGTVMLPEALTWGLYFISEVKAPEGYLLNDGELGVFVGRDGDTPDNTYEMNVEIPNEPVKGRIVLHKKGLQHTGFEEQTDAYGNTVYKPIFEEKYLAGAVFEVYAAEQIVGGDGTVWYEELELVDTITTTEIGSDKSKELPLGKYILVETKLPEGYVGNAQLPVVDLAYADEHTAVVEISAEIHNTYLPVEVLLTKRKETILTIEAGYGVTSQVMIVPGEACVFGLFMDDGRLVATGETDEDGKLVFSGLYPHGEYAIRELSVPEGWRLDDTTYPVSLLPSSEAETETVIRIVLPDPILNRLIYTPVTITKTDITGEETIPGAQIEVFDENGETVYRAVTDGNGEIPDIPLLPGRYTFREILAPEGFEINEAEMVFTVHEDGTITGDTTICDDYTRIQIMKQDEEDQPLAGATFALRRENGEVLMTADSDANGLVTFERIPYGSFIIEEVSPAPGYLSSSESIRLTVDSMFINPAHPLATVTNHANEALIRKVDQRGNALPGAVFGLFNQAGVRVMTAVSDDDGIVRFEKIPNGEYTISEIAPPSGYLSNKETVHLTVDASYENSGVPIVTLTNHLKRVRYQKVDTSGKYLPGVEFSLINASTGEVVETVTSDDHGEFVFTKFDYGDWIIRETKAPEGYMKMDDLTLHVGDDWVEPEPFACVNIPNHYEFIKVDRRGNPIPGVKFALEDKNGNFLRKLESGEDGIVHVTDLSIGSYVIRETEPAEGYELTDETIEIVIDEKYKVPKRMKRIKNYAIVDESIQTGVDMEVTPVMIAGAGMMAISIVLLLAQRFKRRK